MNENDQLRCFAGAVLAGCNGFAHSMGLRVLEDSGDFDGDGDVDGRDFLVWQRGGSPNPLGAADLAHWQNQFGAAPLAASTAAVPEPASSLLFLLGISVLAGTTRPAKS